MNYEEAFSRILDVEAKEIVNDLSWHNINVWPLVRQCIWLELTQASEKVKSARSSVRGMPLSLRLFKRIFAAAFSFRVRYPSIGEETVAFISRPTYLQALPNGALFDRIVDPLIFCMPSNAVYAKYYVAPWSKGEVLNYPATLLRPSRLSSLNIPEAHRTLLVHVAREVGIEPDKLLWLYGKNLNAFASWLQTARHFLESRGNLKTIYLSCWYFPDMMALVVAARERGIKTIDVQHGKQGKLQAMYSGWRIPEKGYQMMPDIFWNWGKSSAEHILASSPDRRIHRPIIGGFPWLDYYRQHVSSHVVSDYKATGKRILVTTLSPHGVNNQPIPDFILDFMRESKRIVTFIFRCHPNDPSGPEYCRSRLSELPSELFRVDDGRSNLYDSLMGVTHHITADSSCCYEASAFGVPTLLFGLDARSIYKDEIDNGLFSWTPGSSADLELWLEENNSPEDPNDVVYISSSLESTEAILRHAENGRFNYYESTK